MYNDFLNNQRGNVRALANKDKLFIRQLMQYINAKDIELVDLEGGNGFTSC